MLSNIKSSFFIQTLFAYLIESKKLKIIRHNKSIQNQLDISLINYKVFSGRYIVSESKEKIKEYNSYNQKLIYEGEYLNGERSGSGNEYHNNNKIKYSGEYLHGKRNGKGKEFFYNRKLLFEGEYLRGKKWNGIGYNVDGTISYEIKNGNGNITEFIDNGSKKFEGEYLNGQRNGQGKEYFTDYETKIRFEGEYFQGKRWIGKGYDRKGNIIYELKNGKGYIKEYHNYNNVISFEGEFYNGERNGKGKDYYTDGKLKFEGEFEGGLKKGKGVEYDSNGELIYEGEYLYDHLINGKEYIKGKLKYEGDFLYDKKWNGKCFDENGNIICQLINGKGTVEECDDNGELIYSGEYLNGIRNGNGKEYEDNILVFEGIYLDGNKIKGKEFYSDGTLFYEGEFLNDMRNGKGKEYNKRGIVLFEGEYLNGEQWNGKAFNKFGNGHFEIKNGIRI